MWQLFLLSWSECASELDVESVALETNRAPYGPVPVMGQPVITGWPFLRGETRMGT